MHFFFAHLKLLLCRILIYLTFVPTNRNTEYKVGIVALFSQPINSKALEFIHWIVYRNFQNEKKTIEGRGNELACSVGPSPFHSHKINKCFPALSRL